jgi:DNA-binding NtrC family response regulator
MVVEGEAVTVHDLAPVAGLLVGRGADVGIQLTDPSASVRHARLHVENGRVAIEDLGSRNGTQVRGERIGVNELVPLVPGDAALLGSAVLIVQVANRALVRRRVWSHEYFELRVAEECEVSSGGRATFSVARIDVGRAVSSEEFMDRALDALRPSDVVGEYGPGAFEILLRRATPAVAESILATVATKVHSGEPKPKVAFAHFPGDGQGAHALIEKACGGVRASAGASPRPGIVILDEHMKEIYLLAEKAASRDISILILGETGVGKEVLAETIHRASKRVGGPFLCLNCAALAENLLESELFGHERGAFTDAKATKTGLLESAAGGTVFLDEIGEMSPTMQAKLLRAIETRQIMRVGGLRPVPIDVRFVAATHRDLVQEIRERRFRSDLYYRLNTLVLSIPALRERVSEILPLCEGFLEQLASREGTRRAPRICEAARRLLESYPWPGNVRELRNVMERALLLSDGGEIEPEHLPLEMLRMDARPLVLEQPIDGDGDRWNREEKAERARILEALRAEGGNQTRAARRLGMARGTLLSRIDAYDIGRPQKR